MKTVLISSFDMEVGGVERSLINMLNNFDCSRYCVDLMLYSHTGDLFNSLPKSPNLLQESKSYRTFRMSIQQTLASGNLLIGLARIVAKFQASRNKFSENGYKQMQYMWKYSLPFLPKLKNEYDVAISYLWPHYFIAEKVTARIKIAWIHTDFSTVETNVSMDLKMWNKFDYIVAVSQECKESFKKKYRELEDKVLIIENITSQDIIRKMASEDVTNPMAKDTRFKLLTVARLSHAKGIDNAVKALRLLKDRGYENIVWYVVGYGGDKAMIEELISRYDLENNFILLGKKTNPYPYIKECDLYVQPSRYEGKAVTVTEAQILSKPVLITNYPTARSQINNNIDGVICELSVAGLAKGIEELFTNEELRKTIITNVADKDYCNSYELEKLYRIMG